MCPHLSTNTYPNVAFNPKDILILPVYAIFLQLIQVFYEIQQEKKTSKQQHAIFTNNRMLSITYYYCFIVTPDKCILYLDISPKQMLDYEPCN